MGRPKLTTKAKRNNFTLNKQAQAIIDTLPKQNKSAYVSQALIAFKPIEKV
jgi:hypothetical protein